MLFVKRFNSFFGSDQTGFVRIQTASQRTFQVSMLESLTSRINTGILFALSNRVARNGNLVRNTPGIV